MDNNTEHEDEGRRGGFTGGGREGQAVKGLANGRLLELSVNTSIEAAMPMKGEKTLRESTGGFGLREAMVGGGRGRCEGVVRRAGLGGETGLGNIMAVNLRQRAPFNREIGMYLGRFGAKSRAL